MSYARRPGFALLFVLWMLVGIAALSVGLASSERQLLRAGTNRMLMTRGTWLAEGCIARARAVIDDTLHASTSAAEAGWRSIDSVLAASRITSDCTIEAHPVGTAIDVNGASPVQLVLAMESLGVTPEVADSLADAILDWVDSDDSPRAAGAEAVWYRARHLRTPRNGPIFARAELSRVRGVRGVRGADSVLGVERGRLLIGRASMAVLASVPGFGPEALARASSLGSANPPRDLLAFSSLLTPPARTELLAHYAVLQSLVTLSPDAWIVSAKVAVGAPPVVTTMEVRLERAGSRAAVVRQKMWP